MPARNVRKNFQLFLDGRGYAGQAEDVKLPELVEVIEDWRGGGMDGSIPIEMGMEAMEMSANLICFSRDVMALWGLAPGVGNIAITLRSALESEDGTITPEAHYCRGKVTGLDQGTVKAGEKSMLAITMKLSYYRRTENNIDVIEIDVPNMVRKINGIDRLAAQRAAIGK